MMPMRGVADMGSSDREARLIDASIVIMGRLRRGDRFTDSSAPVPRPIRLTCREARSVDSTTVTGIAAHLSIHMRVRVTCGGSVSTTASDQ